MTPITKSFCESADFTYYYHSKHIYVLFRGNEEVRIFFKRDKTIKVLMWNLSTRPYTHYVGAPTSVEELLTVCKALHLDYVVSKLESALSKIVKLS